MGDNGSIIIFCRGEILNRSNDCFYPSPTCTNTQRGRVTTAAERRKPVGHFCVCSFLPSFTSFFYFFFLNKIPFDEMPSVWLSCRHIIFSPIQNCLTFVDRIFLKLTKILIETELTPFWHLTWISHGRLSIAAVHHLLLHHQSDFVCLVSECNSRESLVCVCLCVCCWVSPGPASIIRLSQNRIKHRHTPD